LIADVILVSRNALTAFLPVSRNALTAFLPVSRNALTAFLLCKQPERGRRDDRKRDDPDFH
jgi:hypothetical protein